MFIPEKATGKHMIYFCGGVFETTLTVFYKRIKFHSSYICFYYFY